MTNDPDKPIFERSCCPIACALDLLGDKWTLLIIRDLLLGKKRYQEFLESPERIATNILADRLKKIESAGLVIHQAYQQKPVRYEYALTKKGAQLDHGMTLTADMTHPSIRIPRACSFNFIGNIKS